VFRQRPAALFFKLAAERNVGILARVPLASGLLTGKYSTATTFEEGDHRHFNRDGAHFDKGETFSGINYELGLRAVDRLKALFPGEENLAPRALQWILTHPEISCVIPGASKISQVHSNLSIYQLPELTSEQISAMNEVYEELIKPSVHYLW
jgi:aryl-alcohol dehydrogenase-like predicted oxidoreductase